jgi:hypothetical protein
MLYWLTMVALFSRAGLQEATKHHLAVVVKSKSKKLTSTKQWMATA